ncbi:Glutathione S-transferase kappa 1 [Modicella reniformis]|uniref:Glutathione S-transferase kappa 1 n=1 Tax=Modicella reniformis TaxID=1440133 RepID=A0A9P6ILE5_9FUNG|nr:Glutathione S-transferase kappa 1 [Modicella reniformis]
MRVLTALQMHEATEKYEACIDKDEYFVHNRNISQPEVIQAALAPLFNSDISKIQSYLQLATQPEIKQIFKEYTDEAIARGVFGAPTIIIKKTGEPADKEYLFFGSDRFEVIAAFLGQPYSGLIPKNSSKI